MLDNILLFTELVEHKSFTKAATSLNITQSTLSKRISILEQELNLNLIVHHTRKFEITADGEIIYQKFKHLRQYLKENIEAMHNKDSSYKSSLNICVSTSFAYSVICPYLPEFLEQNPDLTINMFFKHAQTENLFDYFDITITNYMIKEDGYDCIQIASEVANLFCTPRYKEKYGIPEHIHELEQHRFIGIMNNAPLGVPKALIFRHRYKKYEYTYNNIHPQLKTNLPSHMKIIGMAGDYIFACWKSSCQEELSKNELIHILEDYETYQSDFYLTLKSTHGISEKKFLDFVRYCINKAL